MSRFTTAVTVVAAVGFVVLLWRLDIASVAGLLVATGWGMLVIVGQEIVAHGLNALGWRFAFDPRTAASVPFATLVQLRIAGDAINYVTPTATLAGEASRTAMLRTDHRTGDEAASVIVAKLAQTLGQALFVAGGIVLFAWPHLSAFAPPPALGYAAALLAAGLLLVPGVRRALAEASRATSLGRRLGDSLRHHRGRFAVSTLLFATAYAWGIVEAYWICRCLGLRLAGSTIVTIEVLSAAVDGVLFMVPAKIGTQEGGKTAIFATLGLSPSAGFAFGLLRHVRELVWTCIGLLICALWRRGLRPGGSRRVHLQPTHTQSGPRGV